MKNERHAFVKKVTDYRNEIIDNRNLAEIDPMPNLEPLDIITTFDFSPTGKPLVLHHLRTEQKLLPISKNDATEDSKQTMTLRQRF